MRWQCFATDHEPLLYDRSEEFEYHMKTDHAGSFPDDQLPSIVEISAQPITPTLDHCPFCSETAGDLEEHVGQHLREFALHSLPWPDYVEGGSQDGSQSDGMGSKKGTRETVKEARDSLPPLIFDNVTESEEMSNNEPGRLGSYGYLREITAQHEPLHNNLELLKDQTIGTFACIRYGVDSTQALVRLLSAQPGASSRPVSEQLWNKAYDNLKQKESKLVDAYEWILSRELEKDDSSPEGSQMDENSIEQTDKDKRWSQMERLVQAGLKKTERESKMKQTVGAALQGLLSLKDLIGSGRETTPQAALAWTGICFAMQVGLSTRLQRLC